MNRFTKPLLLGLIGFFSFTMQSCKDDEFDSAKQLEKEKALIDEYITDNNLTALTDTLGAGLKYVVLKEGTGSKPVSTDIIHVSYKGTVMSSGVEFDSSDSAYFTLSNLIAGWQIILLHVKQGAKVKMFIPSYYAYGTSGSGKIPANEPIIFEVELKNILDQVELEQLKIAKYLNDNNIDAEVDEITGLRYLISDLGTGSNPNIGSTVNVDYKGFFVSNKAEFTTGVGTTLELSNLITGWQVLLPKIKEGGKITMYLPSKYAFGTGGSGIVPGNTPVIFEVKLNSIVN